jgi:hypothetical protein
VTKYVFTFAAGECWLAIDARRAMSFSRFNGCRYRATP